MKNEIFKVLKMVEEGKIDSEKAAELIALLKENGTETGSASPYLDKTLKIRVIDKDGNVNINIPIRLLKALLKTGYHISANLPASEKYLKNIDLDMILSAVENDLDGQLVDISSPEGEKVSVVIE